MPKGDGSDDIVIYCVITKNAMPLGNTYRKSLKALNVAGNIIGTRISDFTTEMFLTESFV